MSLPCSRQGTNGAAKWCSRMAISLPGKAYLWLDRKVWEGFKWGKDAVVFYPLTLTSVLSQGW